MANENLFLFDIAEPPPILLKDSERRAQYQAKRLLLSVGIAEPPPVLLKDSERRAQWQMLGKGIIVYMR